MKKVLVILTALTLTLGSCKKEEICNCGKVRDSESFSHPSGNVTFYLTVKSDCSNMVKTMKVTSEEFYAGFRHDYICLPNNTAW